MNYKNIKNERYCKFVKQSKAKQSKAKPLLYLLNNFKSYIPQFFMAFNFLSVFIRFAKNKFAILNNNVTVASACYWQANCVNNSEKSTQGVTTTCYKKRIATPSALNGIENNFAILNLVKSFLTLIKFNFDNLSKKNINLAIKNLKEIKEDKGFIYA